MTFTFSSNDDIDYAQLGMCPICAVRFTHGCEHSNTIESQQWLAAYIVAEQLDSEAVEKLVAENYINPAAEAYQMEHEAEESTADEWLSHLDTNPDPRTPEQRDLDEWQADSALTRESDRPQ